MSLVIMIVMAMFPSTDFLCFSMLTMITMHLVARILSSHFCKSQFRAGSARHLAITTNGKRHVYIIGDKTFSTIPDLLYFYRRYNV